MSDYTPTTSHILEAFAWDEKYDGLDTKRMEQFYRWLSEIKKEVSTKAHFEHWLAEVKAQAWEEGITAFDVAITKDVDDPWSQLPDNPYRQGEGSGNTNSQPTAETPTYLNLQGEEQ